MLFQKALVIDPENESIYRNMAQTYKLLGKEKEAQAAIQAAHETLRVSVDQRERIMAEAALRRALLEIKVAERSRKNRL